MIGAIRQTVHAEVDGHELEFCVLADDVFRLRIAAGTRLERLHSYAILPEWMPSPFPAIHTRAATVLQTEDCDVELSFEPFSLVFRDRGGFVRWQTAPEAIRRNEQGLALRRQRTSGEKLFGLGEAGETFDKTGQVHTLWNTDDPAHHPRQSLYCQFPLLHSVRRDDAGPCTEFVDNPGRTVVDAAATEPTVVSFRVAEGDLVAWIILGDSLRALVRRWTDLTGRMLRPPRWALGYQQCRWSYSPESEVREIACGFRQRQIPCDVLYLDIDYMDGYRVFTWDSTRFPDPKRLVQDLAADGFHVVPIVDPGVKIDPEYSVYRQMLDEAMYCKRPDGSNFQGRVWPGAVNFPDFTRADVRRRWGIYQEETLLAHGVAGIWNDMNEPADFDLKTFPDDVIQEDDGQRRPHSRIHQIYGLTMAQASHVGQLRYHSSRRPFTLTRSGYAGIQRYSAVWTGDNQSVWRNMEFDLQLNLNMGMSGIAFVGCDIGGFGWDCSPQLYLRWIEWGVFQPFVRTHTAIGTARQEPWSFGPAVERIAKRMIELRMTLLPYIYTQFVHASETGDPVNRPLLYEDGMDATLVPIGDEFLLGPDLLVAPVMTHGMDRRMVYLPAGTWYHWWTERRYEGSSWRIIEAPHGQPPLFVRAGAVIPRGPVVQHTGADPGDTTFLDIFPADHLHGELIEDDGITLAYREGVQSVTRFSGTENASELRLQIDAPEGPWRGSRKQWTCRLHRRDWRILSVKCDDEPLAFHDHRTHVEWTLPDKRQLTRVVVRYAGAADNATG